MVTFFRRIRRNLFSEGNTGKYFKYAIGEIILVVIGILIALQVNNWNENRKIENIKQNYYGQILADLEEDKKFAEKLIAHLDSSVALYNNYKETYKANEVDFDMAFKTILKNNFHNTPLEFRTSTIHTLISTGDIKLFKPSLREELSRYNARKDFAMEVSARNQNNALHILESAMMSGLTSMGNTRDQPVLKEYLNIKEKRPDIFMKLDAYFNWKHFGEEQTIRDLSRIKEDIETLLKLVNDELEV